MLSLADAQRKYYEVNKPDLLLMQEHARIINSHILSAIEANESECIYEVPWMVPGCFPLYNVEEIMLELVRQARQGGYNVQILSQSPPILRIWGWGKQPQQQQVTQQSNNTQSKTFIIPPKGSAAPARKPRAPRKKQDAVPQFTLADAKRGVLSTRLKHRIARIKGIN